MRFRVQGRTEGFGVVWHHLASEKMLEGVEVARPFDHTATMHVQLRYTQTHTHLSSYPCVCVSICRPVCLSVCLSILFICLFHTIHLSMYLSTELPVFLSIHALICMWKYILYILYTHIHLCIYTHTYIRTYIHIYRYIYIERERQRERERDRERYTCIHGCALATANPLPLASMASPYLVTPSLLLNGLDLALVCDGLVQAFPHGFCV